MADIEQLLKDKKLLIDSIIRKYIPSSFTMESAEMVFGKAAYEYDLRALNKAIAEPFWDFLNRGGKRWRPVMFLLIAEVLGADVKKVQDFSIIAELAHEGSIMIDDIEDSGEKRRGKLCTHRIYGVDIAINLGSLMYFLPLSVFIRKRKEIDKETLIRAYEAYSQEMTNIHLGQATDIWWHRGREGNVTEQLYMQMCAYKTGTLARLAARLAVIFSGKPEAMEKKFASFAESVGIAFQIHDDILSTTGSEFAEGKGYGDDITEGKRSFVVIHALNNAPGKERKRLAGILNMHTTDRELIREAIEIIKKCGSPGYASGVARRIVEKAWMDVEPLMEGSEAKRQLKSFADFLVERKV